MRLQSARLLYTLLTYVESKATMHLEKILTGYLRSVRDEDAEVGKIIVRCAEVTGKYTAPEIWGAILLPRLLLKGASSSEQIGLIIIMAALVRTGDRDSVSKYISTISSSLMAEEVCAANNPEMLEELLLLIEDIIDAADAGDALTPEVSFSLFATMVNVRAASGLNLFTNFTRGMNKLAQAQSFELQDLYNAHTSELLNSPIVAGCVIATFRIRLLYH